MQIIDFYTDELGTTCADCGTGITNCYVLSDGIVTMVVGSECAKRLSESDPRIKREISWIARIKKEWKAAPASETESMFINRRLSELRNAYTAYGAFTRIFGHEVEYRAMIILRNERKIPAYIADAADQIKTRAAVAQYIEETLTAIELKFNANRYDFVGVMNGKYYGKRVNEVPKY